MKVTASETSARILEEILNLNGKCLDAPRCTQCPLREKCLPTFYQSSEPKSRFQDFERVNLAAEILTQEILMDDNEFGKEATKRNLA